MNKSDGNRAVVRKTFLNEQIWKENHMNRMIAIAAVFVAGVTSLQPVFAQPNGPKGMHLDFAKLDTNGDGFLTMEEIIARKSARFSAADTNGDGLLSEAEILAHVGPKAREKAAERVRHMIGKRDRDGDGMLSIAEIGKGKAPKRLFARLDSDGDGAISKEEFETARAKWRSQHGTEQKTE